MSHLVSEDAEYLYLFRYLHDEPDSFSAWEMADDGKGQKYSQTIQEAEHYAFYECRVDYRINKQTGDVEYLSIR